MTRKFTIVFLCFLLLSNTVIAASKLEELEAREKEQERKIAELNAVKKKQVAHKNQIAAEYNKLTASIDEKNSAIHTLFSTISKLEQEASDLGLEVDDLLLQMEQKNIEIDRVKLDLDRLKNEKLLLKKRGALRIKSLYEDGEPDLLEIMIQSTSIADFFNKVEYISKLVESDHRLFEDLVNAENETIAVESSLEIAEETLSFIVDDKNKKVKELDEKVEAKNIEMANVEKLVKQELALREEIDEEKAKALEDLASIQAQEAAFDRELDAIIEAKRIEINNQNGVVFSGGQFIWPLPGYKSLSSPFGWRTIFGKQNHHNGIDIPAPRGTHIKAAGAGEVIESRYIRGYGECIFIGHGDGYVTVYAHMSKRISQKGDVVETGQLIGEVGTTGRSTGNHLHFGIKKGGSWQNPMNYVH